MSFPISTRVSKNAALALAASCALLCAPAQAAPPHGHAGGAHPGGGWHGGPRFFPRPYFRPFIALPPSPFFYGPSYYPGYPYGAYDPSGAYLPPQEQGPVTYIEAPGNAPETPDNYIASPATAPPPLPLEQRVQRLKDMCDKGLFTPEECASRRQELLNQM